MASTEMRPASLVNLSRDSLIVPGLLGAGLLCLYNLPVAGAFIGGEMGVDYSVVREVMGWAGYSWVNVISMVGIAAAAGASIVSQQGVAFPRRAIMLLGSVLGLALPIFLLITGSKYLGLGSDGFGAGVSVGAGIVLYSIACIASWIVAGAGKTSGVPDFPDRTPPSLRVWLASSADVLVPMVVGVGVAAVLVLPTYDFHPRYMLPNPSIWDVLEIGRVGFLANYTWIVLVGLGTAIITSVATSRMFRYASLRIHRSLLRWGPIIALLLPFGLWLRWIGGFRQRDYVFESTKYFFEYIGSGVAIFTLACVIATMIGWVATRDNIATDQT